MKKRVCAAVLTAVFLLFPFVFVSCVSTAGVSAACTAYAAGTGGGQIRYAWHDGDGIPMPAEITRAFVLYCARFTDDETLMRRIVYKYDAAYMKTLLEKTGHTPEAFLEKMREEARSLGMKNTVLCSVTGEQRSENALFAAFGREEAANGQTNATTPGDLLILLEALMQNEHLAALYGGYTAEFPESSAPVLREAQLLVPSSERYYEKTVFELGGWVAEAGGKRSYVQISCAESSAGRGYAAVADSADGDHARRYAAVDAGNLSGRSIGEEPDLSYLPESTDKGAGLPVGSGIFGAVIVVLFAVFLLLLAAVAIAGVVVRMKRNIEGRKKYAGQGAKKESGTSPADGNEDKKP